MCEAPKRKPVRLTEYDYSAPGAYFVTICTHEKRCILSEVAAGDGVLDAARVHLTEYGTAVEQTLLEIDRTYDHISIDNYVIMPNHVHFIVSVTENGTSGTPSPTDHSGSSYENVGAGVPDRPPSPTNPSGSAYKTVGAGVPDRPRTIPSKANATLPMLISTFKRFTNKKCGMHLWQRSYYEHVIRGERDYAEIWTYIDENPAKWTLDRYYET